MVAAAEEEVAQEDFDAMLSLASTLQRCPEKPTYHVMCNTGWLNDPNGPIYHGGKYHLFYQHIINGCEWDFGIVWGHAVSDDLVHWQHLPPALLPTPGGADADGCFSGCCIRDSDGTPIILYTGVRLRSNPECGALPPPSCDLNLPFVESQLSAKPADAGDPHLATWVKDEQPLIGLPPPDMGLVGWRDPFIFEVGNEASGSEWGMLMGSGLKGRGGAVMIYRATTLLGEWRYAGMLCVAENTDTGAMWECPLLLELQPIPDELRPAGLGAKGYTHLRSRSESYRSTVASDSDWSSEDSDSSDSDSEPIARQPNGIPNGTAAPAERRQPQQPRSSQTFEEADESSDAAALAGHPEDGVAGQTVADGIGPGMGGATLDEAAAEQARESVDGMAAGAGSSREADGELQWSDADGLANGTGRQSNGASRLPVSQLSSKLNGLKLEAEPPPPRFTHLLCVSPDAPTNPVLYWLGLFDAKATEFLLEGAKGPIRLDLGDVLYAPNLQTDAFGRDVMWGWLQERRKAGTYDYSGCMTVPRLLYIEEERLIQIPIPEIKRLRTGKTWTVRDLEVPCDAAVPLPGEMGSSLDMTLILQRGEADAAGLLFRSWNAGGEGSAAILFDFTRNILEAVFEGAGTDLATSQELYPEDDTVRRVGGPTELAQGEDCHLRILVDHSCIEVFAGSGEVLSTRIYRGSPPPGADSGISFVSFGGSARVAAADAWEMGTIWREEMPTAVEPASIYEPVSQDVPQKPPSAIPGVAIPVA